MNLTDLDAHLQLTSNQLLDLFGARASTLPYALGAAKPSMEGRAEGFDAARVWQLKGSTAFGAAESNERLCVLNAMGISRQLVLPRVRVALAAWRSSGREREEIVRNFNGFLADWQSVDRTRLRGVGIACMTTPAETLAQIAEAAGQGIRAVLLPCFEPPGGLSPSDPQWDPVWQLMADRGIALILHAGSEQGFVDSHWTPPQQARPIRNLDGELRLKIDVATVDMFKLVTLQYGPQVFLSALLLGGVLSRYRQLRLAVVELGAGWVAPYVRMLDARTKEFGAMHYEDDQRLPSEVFVDQVRFTPYHWEPVDRFLGDEDLFPLYAFSTDFPHSEGGHQTYAAASKMLTDTPREVRDSYFSKSAMLILGDPAPASNH